MAYVMFVRRSSSFFWTPTAHLDFEKAIGALTARGAEVTPGNIMQLMTHHSDLKMTDIDRHLKKKQLVQRRRQEAFSARENRNEWKTFAMEIEVWDWTLRRLDVDQAALDRLHALANVHVGGLALGYMAANSYRESAV